MTPKELRIAKFLADAGIASRREAEKLILSGFVSVNGQKISSPALNVTDEDEILVSGQPVKRRTVQKLWAFYKPQSVVTTHKDPQGRQTVFELIPARLSRVLSVGRLDLNSEGLLLLTNSGELQRTLELPSSEIEREYKVRIYGALDEWDVEMIEKGLTIDGIYYKGMKVFLDNYDPHQRNNWIRLILKEGKNREIRKVFEYFDIRVNRLIRLRFGNIELGDLEPGELREISKNALSDLLALVSNKI